MRVRVIIANVVVAIVLTGWLPIAAALDPVPRDPGAQGNENGSRLTLQEAAKLAERKFGGRVLSVSPATDPSGNASIRLKMLTDEGRVRVIHIDPRHPSR